MNASRSSILLAAVLCILPAPAAFAQNFTGGFGFPLPYNDTAAVSFLPQFPKRALTDQDFVGIDAQGRFSVRGNAVRFFGCNLVADGALPPETKAWAVAGRLRKMGFNLVRLHHLDNPWSQWSMFPPNDFTTREINPVVLERLDFFLSHLKANGIYANVNLHVSRTFKYLDGIPDADSLLDNGKGVNYFDPYILMLHKEYAAQLLTHVNKYTGTALVNDPVMAMVEITNENSLYRYWRDNRLKHQAQGGILTSRHVTMLDTLWQSYLKRRYGTDAALAAAWNGGTSPGGGSSMLVNGTFETAPPSTGWGLENDGTGAAVITRDATLPAAGAYCAKIEVTKSDGTDWHLQWKQVGLTLLKDSLYTVTVYARSDASRSVPVFLAKDVSPWTWYGGITMALTPEWKRFTFSVRAQETSSGNVRLSFSVGAQTGVYWIDECSMSVGTVNGLAAGESISGATVRRIDYSECPVTSDARVRDMSAFYIGLENDYFAQMKHYLRDTLGVRVPISGTNWNIGPADLVVQAQLDYMDNHSYWDHPSFPSIPWSSTDWLINNTPMVQNPDGGTIPALTAGVPVAGKPFTISEYNHPFPNRSQVEAVLFLSAYGAFHAADGLMFFDYSSAMDEWDLDKITGYFEIHRNSAMMALMPSCARAYREGLIAPARTTLLLNYAPDDYLLLPRRDNGGWSGATLFNAKLGLLSAVRTNTFSAPERFNAASLPAAPSSPYVSDTRQLVWNPAGLFTVSAPSFAGAAGVFNAFVNQSVGPLQIRTVNGFGAITWVSLTQDSLRLSRRSLLTISSKAQNTGMVWDGTTTLHTAWGSSPTQVAPLTGILQFTVQADSLHVNALTAAGRESGTVQTLLPSVPNTFVFPFDQSQLRTLWLGIEAFGAGVPMEAEAGDAVPREFRLLQNYPNPFNPSTTIEYWLPSRCHVELKVYDLLGREVATLVSETQEAGIHRSVLHNRLPASGMYVYRIQAGNFGAARRMIYIK